MPTMEELKPTAHDQRLIRKILDGFAALAPYGTDMPEAWVGEDGHPIALPTGFAGLGIVEKGSGYEFSSDSDQEEVEGHGYASPVRIDIVKTTRTIKAVCLETNRTTLEQYYGLDLSTVSPDAAGTIEFNESENPARPYSRMVIIGRDGIGADTIYRAKVMPRVQITEVESETWSTEVDSFGLTWTAFPDPVLGYSVKNLIFGPGAKALAADMGFAS